MFPENVFPGQRPGVTLSSASSHEKTSAPAKGAASGPVTALLLAITALWCAYWFLHARGFWEDDAWIHLEFARSVAEGHGFSFNGITVSADTAPLWVILLVGMHALIPDWMVAGKLLALLGALTALSGVYALARRIACDLLPLVPADLFAAAMVLLTAVNAYTCYWIFSGMETLAAAGIACWAVLLCTSPRPTAYTFVTGCALAGVAPLLRPEMFVLAALLALAQLRQLHRIGISPSGRRLLLAVGVVLLAAPLAIWSAYSLHAFGHLLPSTVAAKRDAPGKSVVLRILEVYGFALPILLVLLPLVPFWLRGQGKRSPASNLFLLWTALTTVFYVINHTYVQTRYVLVSAPALMAIFFAFLVAAWPRTGRATYAATLLWSAALSIVVVRPFLHNKEIDCRASAQMAAFIRHHVPPDAPVAVYSIGEIAFLSQHPIVDTGGVTRPGALPYLNQPPDAALHWAETEGAQYDVAGSDPPEPGAIPILTVPLAFTGWNLHISKYSESLPLRLWQLPAHPASSQVAANAPGSGTSSHVPMMH